MSDNMSDGLLIVFEHYIRMNDGRLERSRDQMMFPGSVEQFKKVNPKVAVIGYHTIVDGVVTEECTMLNEKLPDINSNQQKPFSGAITPELMQQAAEKAFVQEKPQETQGKPSSCQNHEEKIFKDGDSFIKIVDGKVFKLKWKEYDDSTAQFDKKIKYSDGKIMITDWEELAQ